MDKANEPAMPSTIGADRYDVETLYNTGLTKREHFAGLAMQGLLSNSRTIGSPKTLAELAYKNADALLAELEQAND